MARTWRPAGAVVLGGVFTFLALVSLDAGGFAPGEFLHNLLLGPDPEAPCLEMPASSYAPVEVPTDRLYATPAAQAQPAQETAAQRPEPVPAPAPAAIPAQSQPEPAQPEAAPPAQSQPAPAPVRRLIVTSHLGLEGPQTTAAHADASLPALSASAAPAQTAARQVVTHYGGAARSEIMMRAVGRVWNFSAKREARR